MITINQLFTLLINCAMMGSAGSIDDYCLLPNMVSTPYITIPQDENLPSFNETYWFTFPYDKEINTRYEILIKDNSILQAGVEFVFNSDSLDSYSNTFYEIYNLAKEYFGETSFFHQGGFRTYSYGNDDMVFYILTGKIKELPFVIFRVGNTDFYR
ncbi:MAG: hypothetical protein GWP19_09745 [Planctomycetia bacterium]|nr:hypothetical protein [Planctomycetia bacterium]